MLLRNHSSILPIIGVTFLTLLGLIAVDGFGVSADEPAMLAFGEDTFAYLFQGGPIPRAADWRFHGPVVQLLFVVIQKILGLTDGREIWLLRHFFTYVMFLGGVSAFVTIAWRRFGMPLALLGGAFFVLSPRVFAHGFFNPKDIPTMCLFTVSILTLLRFSERPTIGRLLLHTLATAVLVSLRTAGVMVALFTILMLLHDSLRSQDWVDALQIAAVRITAYLIVSILLMILIWPALWTNPLSGFLYALSNSASRGGGGFYFGQAITGTPWHYVPVWIAITTPVLYSLLFLTGLGRLIVRLIQQPPLGFARGDNTNQKPVTLDVLFILWFLLPLLSIPLFGIGVFDGWRHLFFIYPAFLLIALIGLEWLIEFAGKYPRAENINSARPYLAAGKGILARGIIGIVTLSLASTALWMLRHHPHHYAYFNLPARAIASDFERDEWGLSYRQGLEWILRHDDRKIMKVYGSARVVRANADLLPLEEWDRLRFVAPGEADYILDNFRANNYREVFPADRELHAITVNGLKLLAVYRGPDTEGIFEAYSW